ncbi:transcription factor of the MADS box [Tulasnella sp. 403]|nr:transcription factor of the MADS box [Tulasnella sp. 403]
MSYHPHQNQHAGHPQQNQIHPSYHQPQHPQHLPGPPSPDSPTAQTSRKRPRPADLDTMDQPPNQEYKDYAYPPQSAAYYDSALQQDVSAVGAMLAPASAVPQDQSGGFAIEHEDEPGDDDDDDIPNNRASTSRAGGGDASKAGRRKIKIEFIQDKSRRHITFSKRKAGIMKKAYELSTLTGTQVLLLVVSETGLVYTFTTAKLQPLVTQPEGKNLIQGMFNLDSSNFDPYSWLQLASMLPLVKVQPLPHPPQVLQALAPVLALQVQNPGAAGGRNVPGGLSIGSDTSAPPPGGAHQLAQDPAETPRLEVDPATNGPIQSPTDPFHPPQSHPHHSHHPYNHQHHPYPPPPRSVSSSTAASNSSPALTHASPNPGYAQHVSSPSLSGMENVKRARRRTDVAADVSMGLAVAHGLPPGLARRNTMPASVVVAENPESEGADASVPTGMPASSTPEFGLAASTATPTPTPPMAPANVNGTSSSSMHRGYSSEHTAGASSSSTQSPGPLYQVQHDSTWGNGHLHPSSTSSAHHYGHHHSVPLAPPPAPGVGVVQQGWGDYGRR